jgi:hypothetical protein
MNCPYLQSELFVSSSLLLGLGNQPVLLCSTAPDRRYSLQSATLFY